MYRPVYALFTLAMALSTISVEADDSRQNSTTLERVQKLESGLQAVSARVEKLEVARSAPRVEILSMIPWPVSGLAEVLVIHNHSSDEIEFDESKWYFDNSSGTKYVPPAIIPPGKKAYIQVIGIGDFMSDDGDTIRLMYKDDEVDSCSYPQLPQGVTVQCQETKCNCQGTLVAARSTTICVDFTLFPNKTPMPARFTLGSLEFKDNASPSTVFVNESGGRKGLQFSSSGVDVTFPRPVTTVDVEVGAFAQIEVSALDSSGNTVLTQTVPSSSTFVNLTFSALDIASLKMTSDDDEGMLSEICITWLTQ